MENQVENKNPKQKKKVITKIVCVVIAILLMIGIAFIVANYVHKNNALPASADVKNGLSAYELAVEQGYKGSLEEWLKSLDGKSAYEIAVDNGYSGTEDEWNKAIATVSQNNVTIKNAEFSKDGDLIITLSDETIINVGKVAGSDGKDGANGKNGTNGKNGVNGKDGINGIDGQDGKGISFASINENGQLILTFSDGSTVNLDKIVGTNGVDGENGKDGLNGKDGRDGIDGAKGEKGDKGDKGDTGADGKNGLNGTNGQDGIGINTIVVTDDGNLNITLSNGTTLNLGTIKGTDGKDGLNGTDGQDGQDGIGISNVNINTDGELVITFSDNKTINLGRIVGKDGKDGTNGIDGVNGKDGINGVNGKDGQDGIGIDNVTISVDGALTVTLTNGAVLNLGNIKGADGVGISKSEINADGELVLTYTNGDVKNLGKVTGRDGIDGADGTGIKSVTLSTGGELIITLTDNSVLNLGNVKGEKGNKGDKGDTGADGKDGKDGRGIAKTELVNGELIIIYTDGTSDNLGKIGSDEPTNDYLIFSLLEDNTYGVALNTNYTNSVIENINIPSTYKGLPVTRIMSRGFENSKIKSVTLPNSLIIIGDFAFYDTSLTYINIPENVTHIGYAAFAGSKLETADFESKVGWKRARVYTRARSGDNLYIVGFYSSAVAVELYDLSGKNAASMLSYKGAYDGTYTGYLVDRFYKS